MYSSDGKRLGKVEHVLAVPDDDIFDGIVLDTSVLPGGHRFVDAPEVGEIYERGVVLKIDAAAAAGPARAQVANPGVDRGRAGRPGQAAGHDKLRRAWDLISGKG